VGISARKLAAVTRALAQTGLGPLYDALKVLAEETISTGGSNTSYRRVFVQGDLVGGELLVTHNLNQPLVVVAVYDNVLNVVIPVSITIVSPQQIRIGFRDFQAIAGTWSLVIVA
jgi:hypothetical protein